MGFTQGVDLFLGALERQTQRLNLSQLPQKPVGIIMLGGVMIENKQNLRHWYHLGQGSERIVEGFALANKFPDALVLHTGGVGSLRGINGSEAQAFNHLIADFKPIKNTILVEPNAKNTWQNAKFSKPIINQHTPGPWILVTSAYHMKRALAVFKKQSLDVVPWPVDYRADPLTFPFLSSSASVQFSKWDILLHEWFGLIAYQLTGRS